MHLALSPIAHISDHFERFVYLNSRSQRDSPESLLRDASVPVEVNRVLVEGDVVKIAATAPSPQQIERARSALSGHGRDGGHKRAVLSAGDYSADVAALSLAILTSFANHHPDRALVLNLWVDSIDRATGHDKRVCVLTVASASSTVLALNLEHVEPTACVKALGASTSRSSKELAPVRPIIAFDKVDARFVEPSDVRAALDSRPNLLELTPGEFESLIENLFRAIGLDTHLTRASRDGGVDCVAYDHRPVFGGKVVIQAKRYSRVVGVSAVRDLFGATHNEGANKGILVTTSHYGKASYEFAANKPLELIDGSALLYLLKEHLETEAKIVVPSDWVDPSDD
jgi:restriction system protein